MTESLANVVIPYSRFLEYQERRRSVPAELMLRDRPPTIDPDVVSVAAGTAPQTLKGKQC
jgi:hypothetical protein